MAINFFDCKGYGQIEPSQVWFNRAGMVEAQCELDPTVFASTFPVTPQEISEGKIVAENGAFLMVDKDRKIATIPTKVLSDYGFKMGINYSTERIYNQYTPGRRNFCMIAGEYLPRIGFVESGMRICTNAVAWDTEDCEFITTNTDLSLLPTGVTIATASSKDFYNAVKKYLATVNNGISRKPYQVDTEGNIEYVDGKPKVADTAMSPIYCGVTDGSQGKLVIGINPKNAIGGVLGIVTQAYYNADNTDSFKIMFIDPSQIPTT